MSIPLTTPQETVLQRRLRDSMRFWLLAITLVFLAITCQTASATEVQRVVSPGGIEAWLVEEETVPLVALNFAFKGGAAQDPAGKSGLANLMSGLLDEGAGDLDSATFQKRLQDNAVELRFNTGKDWFYGSLKTLTIRQDEAFELLRLAVTNPRFDREPVERIRGQILTGLKREETSPDAISSKAWFKAAFPSHPYGRSNKGTMDSVSKVEIDDLKRLHGSLFSRGTLKVAAVGAISAEELGVLLDQVFGDLPAQTTLQPVGDVVPSRGVRVNAEMDIPQTVITFGGEALKRDDPDFIAAFIANHILGGGSFSSRLYTEIREKRGLAYSVSSTLVPYDHSGIFIGGLGTRSDRAADALALVREEISRIADEGPTEEELKEAKDFLIGSYPLRFDTSTKIARQLLGIQIENLGIEYINTRNDQIRAITIDDVRRVAKRIFGNGLIISTVGPSNA